MRLAVAATLALALPAAAEDLRSAPDYFVESVMRTSTANILAVNCAGLSVDLGAISQLSAEILDRLTEDGFTPRILAEEMADPSEAIAVLQDAFLAKHGLATGASEAAVCAAGRAEIAEGSEIGALLLEVDG
ncbi:DUF5333 family protein [Jannaschia seohaensis]|uniref:Uncharacterized protein n=1 Tax=Jannaschia seohaensis TaxID=475081 RepID=A0A2Y9B355_9RHOB|nr:DUF5333 family protein [Jannaschia seohaensis]PWJ12479.1 hypothetical protein BCF38_11637 [Jannaschia seohaensis]SSA50960.1 hypothetical protein SAMN05421539_11637 [Jannaschia seohaensis]